MAAPLATRGPWLLSLALVTTLAAAGLAWQECVLVALAAAAAHRLFLWRMDAGAPWNEWHAGVRCLAAGLLGLLAVAALAALASAGIAGIWVMRHEHGAAVLAALAATGALIITVQIDSARRQAEARFWGVLIVGAAFAFAFGQAGTILLPCLVTAAVMVWLARASWRLARVSSSELLRAWP